MATINTPYGTLSFPHFFSPKPRAEGGEAVYSGCIIFNQMQQKTPPFKALQDGCIAAARKMWGDKLNLKDVHMPFRDGADKAGQFQGYEDGFIFINPWSKSKPGIVDVQRQEILAPEDVWSGQLVRFNVTPYAWTNSGRKGVSFALNHVQIIKTDTPRIDGRAAAHQAFDDGEVDESADSLF